MHLLIWFPMLAAMAWAGRPAGPVRFQAHVIEPNFPNGYALALADLNRDRRPDLIAVSTRGKALTWYENPGGGGNWRRHVFIDDRTGIVNVAAHDLDGDGIPEVAFEDEFSMVAANSKGLVWLLRHEGDPRRPWRITPVDALVTSHHLAWADVDGNGSKELINAPLIGPKALAPNYGDHVPLVYYHTGDWKRRLIDDTLFGVLHRVRPVRWDGDRREELLTASFDGIKLHRSEGRAEPLRWKSTLLSKGHEEPAPRAGASDVAVGKLGRQRFLASVEPWHGNEVVVYSTGPGGNWERHVIYDQIVEGHEVVVADFNGDGLDDIAAGDRNKAGSSVHVFFAGDARGRGWQHQVIDNGGMAGSGCASADLNGDRRPDIACIGAATGNIKWYENLGR